MNIIKELGLLQYNPITNEKLTKARRYSEFLCPICNLSKILRNDAGLKAKSCKECSIMVQAKSNTTHGDSKTRLYTTYRAMISRCYDSKHASYTNYGKKGVTVCDLWRDSFETFKEWALLNGYDDTKVLDKDGIISNSKMYSPETCQFISKLKNATIKQSHNTSGYVGVSYVSNMQKFKSTVGFEKKSYHIGLFNTAVEAAVARDAFIKEKGWDHTLNFPSTTQLKGW